jgi:hypothetical protein
MSSLIVKNLTKCPECSCAPVRAVEFANAWTEYVIEGDTLHLADEGEEFVLTQLTCKDGHSWPLRVLQHEH